MKETREERFKRLATNRTNAVLDKLRILGNLSNRANYDYKEEEVKKIFRTIENQIKEVKSRFRTPKKVRIEL